MKYQLFKARKIINRFFGLTILSFICAAKPGFTQCPQKGVDLAAVSLIVTKPSLKVDQAATIKVLMVNNGPCPIPKGAANVQISIRSDFFDLGSPVNFKNDCGFWTYLGDFPEGNSHVLYFANNGGEIPIKASNCNFSFDIKGKADSNGPSPVILGSSVPGDLNGNNQVAKEDITVIISAAANAPKIVDLPGLEIKANNCQAVLNWKPTTENNIDSFEIEYSKSPDQFVKVGSMVANRSTGDFFTYGHEQGAGTGYYRVKLIPKSGPAAYSKVIVIDTKCAPKKGF